MTPVKISDVVWHLVRLMQNRTRSISLYENATSDTVVDEVHVNDTLAKSIDYGATGVFILRIRGQKFKVSVHEITSGVNHD